MSPAKSLICLATCCGGGSEPGTATSPEDAGAIVSPACSTSGTATSPVTGASDTTASGAAGASKFPASHAHAIEFPHHYDEADGCDRYGRHRRRRVWNSTLVHRLDGIGWSRPGRSADTTSPSRAAHARIRICRSIRTCAATLTNMAIEPIVSDKAEIMVSSQDEAHQQNIDH